MYKSTYKSEIWEMIVFTHEWKQYLSLSLFIVTLDPWLNEVILHVFIELSSWKFAVASAYRRCGGDKEITYNHKSGAYHLSRNPFSLM